MTAENLRNGVDEHPDHPGVYGMSVQAAVGMSVLELAKAGCLRNDRLGIATAGEIRRAGYAVVRTAGMGHHHTLVVPRDFGAPAASALAKIFKQIDNPIADRRRPR